VGSARYGQDLARQGGAVNDEEPRSLALVEIYREDIPSLPSLLSVIRGKSRRCFLFCDDLSFNVSIR
jgi:uncharacterized protein